MKTTELYIGYRDRQGNKTSSTPRQAEAKRVFYEEDTRVLVLYGGTRGGKTACAVHLSLDQSLEMPGINWLIGHVSHKDIKSSIVDHLFLQCPEAVVDEKGNMLIDNIITHDGIEDSYTVSVPGHINPVLGYTAKYYYRPLDPRRGLANISAQSGLTLGGAILDQFELLAYDAYKAVMTRVSTPPFKLLLTMNPPDDSIPPWWYDFMIDPEKRKEHPGWETRKVVFMNQSDNEYIDEQYQTNLEQNLSKDDQERLLHGKSTRRKGLIYGNFSVRDHVVPKEDRLPVGARFYEIIDWGFTDGALCQYWVNIPSTNRWRLWTYVKAQEETPVEFSKKVLATRWSLINNGFAPKDPKPKLICSFADPRIFDRMQDGNVIARQLMSYVDEHGQRLAPIGINRKGVSKGQSTVLAQITRTVEMVDSGKIEVSEECSDFFTQLGQYKWKKDVEKDVPNEVRVRTGLEKKVVHHFEQMVCLRYFGWIINPNSEYKVEQVTEEEKIKDWSVSGAPEKIKSPFSRFQRNLKRVATYN